MHEGRGTVPGPRIQSGSPGFRRLIGEYQGRLGDEGPGDADALLLAAGELRRLVGQSIAETEPLQGGLRPAETLLAANALVHQWRGHVVQCRRPGQKVVRLEDEADRPAAHEREPVVAQLIDRLAVEDVQAGRRSVQAAQDVHHRGLAGARRPDDRQELAVGNVEIDVLKSGDLDLAEIVDAADFLEPDDRLARGRAHRKPPPPKPPPPAGREAFGPALQRHLAKVAGQGGIRHDELAVGDDRRGVPQLVLGPHPHDSQGEIVGMGRDDDVESTPLLRHGLGLQVTQFFRAQGVRRDRRVRRDGAQRRVFRGTRAHPAARDQDPDDQPSPVGRRDSDVHVPSRIRLSSSRSFSSKPRILPGGARPAGERVAGRPRNVTAVCVSTCPRRILHGRSAGRVERRATSQGQSQR